LRLKILKKLRTANLNSEFTGPYIKKFKKYLPKDGKPLLLAVYCCMCKASFTHELS